MEKIEPFSIFGLYGNVDIFKKKLSEGYSEFAFGTGEWVKNLNPMGPERIVGAFVFYNPNKKISTYETPKLDDSYTTIHSKPFEGEYTEEEFKEHLKKFKIKVGPKSNLEEFVKKVV